jgi:hypothetical protein
MRLLLMILVLTISTVNAQVPRASVADLLKNFTGKYREDIIYANQSEAPVDGRKEWSELYLLHKMLTSESAKNYSTGGILSIPYMTNYGEINVRAEVSKNGIPIANVEYTPYKSLAYADRTPALFYKDLVDTVSYSHPACGSFYTFGWCSEREMAFASASYLLGYKPRIVVKNGHSFTLVNVGKTIYQIDNTNGRFNIWNGLIPSSSGRLEDWYNRQASVQSQQLYNIPVADASWQRIESQLISYLWPQQSRRR